MAQVQSYGLAVLSVGAAVGTLLVLEHFGFRPPTGQLMLIAVAVNTWYGERGPALSALFLAALCMHYFFIEPRHSVYVTSTEIPYFVTFLSLATLMFVFGTVRRRIEADLRQTRDKLKIEVEERSSLLDLTQDSISVRDLDFIIRYWNRGAEEFYGWTQKEAIGKPSAELLRTIFPKPLNEIRAELLRTDRWQGELTRSKKDGTQVVVASRWSLRRDAPGRPVAILETSNDITEQRRRQEEIQALNRELAVHARLFDQTHDSIIFLDTKGIIRYWNHGAEKLYGWSAEAAIGKLSHEFLRTIFPDPISDIEAELFQRGAWEGELKHTKADGTGVVVASRWSLSQDASGQPIVIETNNDITERKHREVEISTLNKQLEHRAIELDASNKELEAFAYSISHDLRAPLRHMAGFAELLRKNAAASLNERSQQHLSTILEAANRMGNLIDDLLAFSRLNRAEAHFGRVNLAQITQEAVAEVRQDAGDRNIAWKIDSLPEWYGDRSMLRLVMVNLISNAVKFTRTRHQAEIAIGFTESKNDHVVIFVRDNGVGFDMKYYNKLFGVFQRLHSQEAFEGTGIGLATVQRIVRRHHGQVWAESTVDGGATFYFSLSKAAGH